MAEGLRSPCCHPAGYGGTDPEPEPPARLELAQGLGWVPDVCSGGSSLQLHIRILHVALVLLEHQHVVRRWVDATRRLHLLELVAVTSGPQIMLAQEVLPLVYGVLGPSIDRGVARNRRYVCTL